MTQLARRLTTTDAVVVGLGSMIGAGVFAAFAPAARAVLPVGTGWALLVALGLAAAVAYANATSSAQLAAQYPVAGGTYVYGRERLGPWWGFVAGWGFVIGKTASCAAMALTFAAYAMPDGAPTVVRRGVAALAVVALTAVNCRGVTRTARVARWLVAFVLLALAVTLTVVWAGRDLVVEVASTGSAIGVLGVLQAAGLLFFAFAGYARVATLGEEVRRPRVAIPRAISVALGITVVVYAAVAVTLLVVLGLDGVAASGAPLAAAADGLWVAPLVRVAAAVASLGALLALVAGVGRTALAMAREGDLPRPLAAVHERFRVPHVAEVTLAAVVVALVATVDLRGAIGFSSFGVLVYYLVANLSAWTQTGGDRRYPRALQVFGVLGCAALAVTLPWTSVVGGAGVLAAGVALRALRGRRRG
ncbi:amino acid permease-associated region [Xylanimonas cellulosilytica DSM 15894]|uniref:Amino acid permease-associated region n=1 Tax=Xylanimonas cellulosilytica (strain DSM 15894 / JCM 12276 / CECT 5975 / KCTC 9989 / LMG 20990 / NBRC 107835 / XIL07) TaxID=446471 RepID=D1BU17_XYLCX|nr:APC family permease [Xylanimonas cellulosilytica]ACZ29181.1 amino acid permease-associated region [Xylanimonas cellulosilytica DSM 15894]